MRSRFPYLDHPGPLPIAHRGGALDAPENTMEAFEQAARLGYRYIETDVHLTADGVLVAFHDESLDRATDRRGRIADLPWSIVKEARVSGVASIPRMDELFAVFPDIRFNIDPKSDASVEPLAQAVLRANALDRVGVGSFSDTRLKRLRRLLGPRLCMSLGPKEVLRLRLASLGAPVGGFGYAGCVQVPVSHRGVRVVDRRFVRAAHKRDLQLHVWTIDDPKEMNALLDLGVDGLITDRPAVLKEVLQVRGSWYPTTS